MKEYEYEHEHVCDLKQQNYIYSKSNNHTTIYADDTLMGVLDNTIRISFVDTYVPLPKGGTTFDDHSVHFDLPEGYQFQKEIQNTVVMSIEKIPNLITNLQNLYDLYKKNIGGN